MPTEAADGNQNMPHILAIEDDAMLLRALVDYLEYTGFKVTQCLYTGADALDIGGIHAAGAPLDIILSDFRLPGDNSGIDVIKAVREEFGRDIPAILFTGDITRETAASTNGIETAKLLLKPVRMQTLVEEIQALLGA
ncbi:MAG: response regulator [Rhodospirillales bacterium]|jgi:two-component system CheB/CheR fusion protein|nr:response regulator [Rhodospirillales bacterium]MDP6644018.1 response regulator [Rhodospirillales bacterium]MDP6843427.1 response regulator [Rhodospirillales bacterium]|tara:strand:- start:2033 stop:2446 length:414 start_codon:yes stop_codon:yes gene_type:complete